MIANLIKILITGSKGQLGQSFAKYWYSDKFELCFTDVKELDITNSNDTYTFIKEYKPDYIFNFAAYTAVDKAETEKQASFAVNVTAVKNLIEAAKINKSKIISISTDFVFSGDKNTPYTEENSTSPLSEYGKTKDLGEKELLLNYSENSMIIRTSWLYSEFGNNFLKTIIKLANQRDELGIIYDQLGAPTYAADLCKILESVVIDNKFKSGIFHFSNEGVASWYDFAYEIVDNLELNCKIKPILTKEYPTPAIRPKYSILDKSKIKNHLNISIPHWKNGLLRCLKELKNENN